MENFPETLQDLMDNFATETQCRNYLAKIKWVDGFICPNCKNIEAWEMAKCVKRCKECRKDISVMADTVFKYSKISLRLWFQAIWLVVSQKQGVSALGLSNSLGIKRQKTSWFLLNKIRKAMTKTSPDLLSGTVEVDEVFLGGVKTGRPGRGALGKTTVLVAVEDKGKAGIGRIRMSVIKDAKSETILQTIQKLVASGSIIRTDQHRSYPMIEHHGYTHKPTAKVSYELGEDTTPLVHRVASLLKRWLLGTHQGGVQVSHLPEYLDEYTCISSHL